MLEGANYGQDQTKRHLIFLPVIFFLKRLAFVLVLVLAREYLWVQVALLNFTALTTATFTLWYMPMQSKMANLFEFFNDCTLLLLTYHLWCFTDIVGEPETRYELGYVFTGVSLGNVSVHLVTMLLETFIRAKLALK